MLLCRYSMRRQHYVAFTREGTPDCITRCHEFHVIDYIEASQWHLSGGLSITASRAGRNVQNNLVSNLEVT